MSEPTWTATEFTLTKARFKVVVHREAEDRWLWFVTGPGCAANGHCRDIAASQAMALKALDALESLA